MESLRQRINNKRTSLESELIYAPPSLTSKHNTIKFGRDFVLDMRGDWTTPNIGRKENVCFLKQIALKKVSPPGICFFSRLLHPKFANPRVWFLFLAVTIDRAYKVNVYFWGEKSFEKTVKSQTNNTSGTFLTDLKQPFFVWKKLEVESEIIGEEKLNKQFEQKLI